jgi:hypothetical protein
VTNLTALDKSRRKMQQQESRERSERRGGVSVPFVEGTQREQVGEMRAEVTGLGKIIGDGERGKDRGCHPINYHSEQEREVEGPEG